MNKKIIFSTGGTGGHILPAVNMMKHLSKKNYDVIIVTDAKGYNFLKDYPEFKFYLIKTSTLINKNLFEKILSFINIFISIIKSFIILKKEKPQLVFGFGGYVSFPISFASSFFNLPLVLYENNIVLGRANKRLLRISKKFFSALEKPKKFPEQYKDRFYHVGHILNKNISNYTNLEKSKNNKNFIISVLGGSLGAQIFGNIVPNVIKSIKDKGYNIEINQQCVVSQKKIIKAFYESNGIKNNIFEFKNDILNLISSSDLVISRCGASTTAELFATCTPFIAIPIPHSIDNHQFLNAQYYENKGCCWLLQQENFNHDNLLNLISIIINDKKKLKNARENMMKNDSKNAYNNIESEIKFFF